MCELLKVYNTCVKLTYKKINCFSCAKLVKTEIKSLLILTETSIFNFSENG